ncbi:MAG: prepilin peptidase [Patescibacteria group bacterium]
MLVNFLIYFFIFVFGLIIGSFLNCVIYRTELQENMPKDSPYRKAVSFLRGKSFCPHCKHNLNWQDLIPVFSFLFLRGKCRYCKKSISIQYPLVEIATGLIFLLIFNHSTERFALVLGFNDYSLIIASVFNLFFLFYVASTLIVIFVYDLKHYLIPDKVLFPAIAVAFVFRILELIDFKLIENFKFQISNLEPLLGYMLAVLIAAGFFFIIWLVSAGRWMGFGDVKLAILLGIILGFPNILTGLFLAFLFGAIIGIGLMAIPASLQGGKKKELNSKIPFGPFLIIGTFVAILWGQQLMQWYLNLLLL